MTRAELVNNTLPDLRISECIPNCKECPGMWINQQLGHRIVCECKTCRTHNEHEAT
jgi:hypothetical protein